MKIQPDYRPLGCGECVHGGALGFDFTMAFQPIVNMTTRTIFGHEALARGPGNEPAGFVFERVNAGNRYRFDQACRVKAVKLGADLGISSFLSINFMPNAVYRPELCIRTTLDAAEQYGFPIDRIILEVTESEHIVDVGHLRDIVQHYKQRGFTTALDDFGAGFSNLNLLAEIETDIVKLDMALTRNIADDRKRQAIVKGMAQVCREMSIAVIAEGIETYEELAVLQSFGLELFQGYYFAKPVFEGLASVASERFDSR
jgi:EAL domain-containing protein (putative c-di-GMP-specific phosphodiesterase class I)